MSFGLDMLTEALKDRSFCVWLSVIADGRQSWLLYDTDFTFSVQHARQVLCAPCCNAWEHRYAGTNYEGHPWQSKTEAQQDRSVGVGYAYEASGCDPDPFGGFSGR